MDGLHGEWQSIIPVYPVYPNKMKPRSGSHTASKRWDELEHTNLHIHIAEQLDSTLASDTPLLTHQSQEAWAVAMDSATSILNPAEHHHGCCR